MSKQRLYEGTPLGDRYIYGKNKPVLSQSNSMDYRKQNPQYNNQTSIGINRQYSKPQTLSPTQRHLQNGDAWEADHYQKELEKQLSDLNMNLSKLNQISPVSKDSTVTDNTWSAPATPKTPKRTHYQDDVPDINSYNGFQTYDSSTEAKFKMDFDMKDFDPEDVSLSMINDRELKIEAKRKFHGGKKISTLERNSRVRIPETVDPKQLKAKLISNAGVLTIEAPTKEVSPENRPDHHFSNNNNRYAMSEDDDYFRNHSRSKYQNLSNNYYPSTKSHRRHKTESSSRSGTLQSQYSSGNSSGRRHFDSDDYHTLPTQSYEATNERDIPINTYNASKHHSRSRLDDRNSKIYGTLPRGRSKPRSRSVGPSHRNMSILNRSMDNSDYYDGVEQKSVPSMASPVRTTTVRANVSQPPTPTHGREKRLSISVFIGEGYRTDQLLVKNILPFDRFIVTAQPNSWQRGEYKRVFNWPAPVDAATISAFLRPDGTLTVSALMSDEI